MLWALMAAATEPGDACPRAVRSPKGRSARKAGDCEAADAQHVAGGRRVRLRAPRRAAIGADFLG